jgi:hypothetical protein
MSKTDRLNGIYEDEDLPVPVTLGIMFTSTGTDKKYT